MPEIVPEITSSATTSPAESFGVVIFKNTVPLPGNPVLLERVKASILSLIPEERVVNTPELAPLIVTLLDVLYIWWLLCFTLITFDAFVVWMAFTSNVSDSITSFVRETFEVVLVLKSARYNVNIISSNW